MVILISVGLIGLAMIVMLSGGINGMLMITRHVIAGQPYYKFASNDADDFIFKLVYWGVGIIITVGWMKRETHHQSTQLQEG